MKSQPIERLICLLCGLAIVATLLLAASAYPLWAASNREALMAKPQMQSLSAVPLFGEDGKLQSLHVTVKYLVLSLNPDGKTRQKHLCSVDVDLIVQAKQRVIVADEIVLLGDLGEDLMTLSDAIWLHRFPSPLPVPRRKAIREKGTSVISPDP